MHLYVKFERSNMNISGVIDINVQKRTQIAAKWKCLGYCLCVLAHNNQLHNQGMAVTPINQCADAW